MKPFLTLALLLTLIPAAAYAGEVPVDLDPNKMPDVPSAVALEENKLVAGGAPNAKGLGQVASQGVRTVIDVRDPANENMGEVKDHAEAVGLRYVNIPLSLDNFSVKQADQLAETLKNPATGPVLLHCATGQRATAVWTLYRNRHEGVPAEQALKEAQAKGLKKPELTQKLQSLLQ